MNIVNRVKNILITPKTEWDVIEKENSSLMSLFSTYLLLLVIIPAAAAFVGMGFVGYRIFFVKVYGLDLGVKFAVIVAAAIIATYFVGAILIDALATAFKGQKNPAGAAKLSAYSLTAACIAGIIYIIPSLYLIGVLGALYGVYIMYLGMEKNMKVPNDQVVGYMLVCSLAMVVTYWITSEILSRILMDIGSGNVRFG